MIPIFNMQFLNRKVRLSLLKSRGEWYKFHSITVSEPKFAAAKKLLATCYSLLATSSFHI